jgi:type VI secretion system FHA domain protein
VASAAPAPSEAAAAPKTAEAPKKVEPAASAATPPPAAEASKSAEAPKKDDAPKPAEAPAGAEAEDAAAPMWNSFADVNKVDWERGGLGVREDARPRAEGDPANVDELVDMFIEATALDPKMVARSPELVRQAGMLLRRLVSGMVVMVEARARAKAEMGAEATGLELDGNNPIKFARSPEQALARLLSPAEPGFMASDRAVTDAYLDLQSHQVATLQAIPGALRATLERFSPGSIRRRAEKGGVLSRIMPALQDAALWRNYEREYTKVKTESDEAFMEVFSKQFRKAYEKQLREGFDDKKG